MTFELLIDQPFDLELTLRCDQGHRWRVEKGASGWYSSVLYDDLVLISQPAGANGALIVRTDADQLRMQARLRWQFRLDDEDENVEGVYGHLRHDPKMKELVDRYSGLRLMRVDPWECLVHFILADSTGFLDDRYKMESIAKEFRNDTRSPSGNDRYPFPSAQDVATTSGLEKLHKLRLGLKATYIHEAGKTVQTRWGDLWKLAHLPSCEHAILELRLLRGVGHKIANCVALFGLGYLDAFPLGDHVLRALKSLYARDPFQPYAGYASQFLFTYGLTIQPEP